MLRHRFNTSPGKRPSSQHPVEGSGSCSRLQTHWMLLLILVLLVGLFAYPENRVESSLETVSTPVVSSSYKPNDIVVSSESNVAVNATDFDWKSRVRFFVLGVQKGGTTSVFRYMIKHPYIIPSQKEKKCFAVEWDPKDPYCERRMNLPKLRENEHYMTGDFSPGYLWQSESVIPRIQQAYPKARFIVVLRQPIRRAYSHYKMKVRYGAWDQPFSNYVLAELEHVRACGLLPHWKFDKKDHLAMKDYLAAGLQDALFQQWFNTRDMIEAWKCTFKDNVSLGMIRQGLYSIALARWFHFFPKDQFLILKNEDMSLYPQREVDRIFQHLDLEPVQVDDSGKANEGNYSALGIDSETLDVLKKLYRSFTQKLGHLLQHDPTWKNLWNDDELSARR